MIAASFLFFLLLFVVVGAFAARYRQSTSSDYLLAGRSVPPWLVALSAVATNNSGYMFIGMIGFTYVSGLSSLWMMVGWIVGDLLSSFVVHKRVREVSERQDAVTFSGLLGRWHGEDFRWLGMLAGAMTVVFLGTYAAAQLAAGAKALEVLFGWPFWVGSTLGAFIVLGYSIAGGMRASIWTDAVQSLVMIAAMAALLLVAVHVVGGPEALWGRLEAVGPGYTSLVPEVEGFGPVSGTVLFAVGWLFAGFGVAGQPHIMSRIMALDEAHRMGEMRFYYYLWFTAFYALTVAVGLAARILLPDVANFDAELALPTLAGRLMPAILVGLVLAGVFAATISTADSLVLACAGSLARDFVRRHRREHYLLTKLGTLFITLFALAIALTGNDSVFHLVLDAWGVLASGFAPLVVVYALGGKPREGLAIAMVLGGVGVLYAWEAWLPNIIYAVAPAMVAGLSIFLAGRALGQTAPAVAKGEAN